VSVGSDGGSGSHRRLTRVETLGMVGMELERKRKRAWEGKQTEKREERRYDTIVAVEISDQTYH
jgi:hypothetical protein